MTGMPVIIIAEAGVNHNGDREMACRLVDAAAHAGADFVKFQTFRADRLATRTAGQAAYQIEATGKEMSQYEMLRQLELDEDAHRALSMRCRERGIGFLSTGFDIESVDFLVGIGIDRIKVPSGEITNLPYLQHIGGLGLPVILSTGMATLDEVRAALDVLQSAGTARENITVLHCTTMYPAAMDDVNLRAMVTMRDVLNVSVGYSDHTVGIEVSVAAAALGASVLEKHFTLDRTLPGPDHSASLEPDELVAMVSAVRNIERALGDGVKAPRAAEMANMPAARKSIVAARKIHAGERFDAENMAIKRPGGGVSPMKWNEMIGRIASRDFAEDELIEP